MLSLLVYLATGQGYRSEFKVKNIAKVVRPWVGSFVVYGKKRKKILKTFPGVTSSGRDNSAMITNRSKLTTEIALYGMFSFHFYR